MRISELYIDGFGHFRDVQIGPLSGRLVVLCGPNEAGKSTLLDFIRTVLFGFPRMKRNEYYPPLQGGTHGGRITAFDDSGQQYVIERHSGANGGPVSIRDDSGQILEGSALPRLLGNASAEVFKNIFAFSLDELQQGGILANSNVNGQIYSAGLGAVRLPETFKALGARRLEIFRSRGSNQEISKLVSKIQDIDDKLNKIRGNAAAYASQVASRDEIDGRLQCIESALKALDSRRSKLRRLSEAWDDWIELVDAEAQLEAIPCFDGFPENAIQRLENIEQSIHSAAGELQDAAGQLEKAEASASILIPDETMLTDANTIEKLYRSRDSFDKSLKELPERRAELDGMEESFTLGLQDLGQGWDEARLKSFDTSIAARDQVERWQKTLSEKERRVHESERQLQQEQKILSDSRAGESEARSLLDSADRPSLTQEQLKQHRAALRTARTRLGEYERKKDNHANLTYQLESSTPQPAVQQKPASPLKIVIPSILALLGITMLAAGVILGQQMLLSGAVTGAALILTALVIYLFARSGSNTSTGADTTARLRTLADKAREEESSARTLLGEAAAPLGLDLPDAAALPDTEARLDAIGDVLRSWSYLGEKLEEAAQGLRLQEKRVEDVQSILERAEADLEQSQQEWRGWLQERSLPEALMPETMVDFTGRVKSACKDLQNIRDKRDRVQAIKVDIQEYMELVVPLARKHSISISEDDPGQVAAAADSLIERLDNARVQVTARKAARANEEEARQTCERRKSDLERAERALCNLLGLAESSDAEEFRRKAAQHTRRIDLETKIHDHLIRLQRLSGPGEQVENLRHDLSKTTHPEIGEESEELSAKIEDLNKQHAQLLEERGGVEVRIGQLESEEESSALRVERNTRIEELREQAREWSKLRLAEELLSLTRDKFQKERQPGVIQHAQEFFTTVTGGRYTRLYAPMGEQTIAVTEPNGAEKRPSELSRGAREQLYLALRFGLIKEFGERAEPLPVIVDEILVNFDPERVKRAAEAFVKLSETNQVLVFTCHPWLIEAFTSTCPDARVIDVTSVSLSSVIA